MKKKTKKKRKRPSSSSQEKCAVRCKPKVWTDWEMERSSDRIWA